MGKSLITEIARMRSIMELKDTELKVKLRQGVNYRDITSLPENSQIETFTGNEIGKVIQDPQLADGEVRVQLDDGRIVLTTGDAIGDVENLLDIHSKEQDVNNDNEIGGTAIFEGIPRKDLTEITVLCRDVEGNIAALIDYIGKNGNTGHSFEIVVDPDGGKDGRKTFYWDGDGSDYIQEVKVNGKTYKSDK